MALSVRTWWWRLAFGAAVVAGAGLPGCVGPGLEPPDEGGDSFVPGFGAPAAPPAAAPETPGEVVGQPGTVDMGITPTQGSADDADGLGGGGARDLSDGGVPDAGPEDAGLGDAGLGDAGLGDAGAGDAGPQGAGA